MSVLGRGLRPDRVAESIFRIDLDALLRLGVRALCLDIDNTLVEWNRPPDDRLRTWLGRARARGFRMAVVSNNTQGRVASFCADLGLNGVAVAQKPRRGGFRRALALIGATPSEAAVIGDQLWTDVWGGNRLGCFTVLVRPLDRREFLGTRVARQLERLWLGVLVRVNAPPRLDVPPGRDTSA